VSFFPRCIFRLYIFFPSSLKYEFFYVWGHYEWFYHHYCLWELWVFSFPPMHLWTVYFFFDRVWSVGFFNCEYTPVPFDALHFVKYRRNDSMTYLSSEDSFLFRTRYFGKKMQTKWTHKGLIWVEHSFFTHFYSEVIFVCIDSTIEVILSVLILWVIWLTSSSFGLSIWKAFQDCGFF